MVFNQLYKIIKREFCRISMMTAGIHSTSLIPLTNAVCKIAQVTAWGFGREGELEVKGSLFLNKKIIRNPSDWK